MNTNKPTTIKSRQVDTTVANQFIQAGVDPVIARLYAARGLHPEDTALDASGLPPKETLEGCTDAAAMLADAVQSKKKIVIIGDYDADGATSTALMLRALRACGADVDFIVPDRILHGYSISPLLSRMAVDRGAQLIVTVDNGISAHAGIAEAKKLGLQTIITDHHLQADTLPAADCIVNPNMRSSRFASRNLAGVGVAFYVLGALRDELKRRGHAQVFNLSSMIDLVAVGTVGDLVQLDRVNRTLVKIGLDKIRNLRGLPGIQALLSITGRNPAATNAETAGFVLAPRINAAGRLATADIGICMLATDDIGEALLLASQLDDINHERRALQTDMTDTALAIMDGLDLAGRKSVVVYDESFHEGVVGLVASHLKEAFNIPSAAFAKAEDGSYKGSFRSIAGVHVRDALDLVSKRSSGILLTFGGHAMAAGARIAADGMDRFVSLFDTAVQELASADAFDPVIYTDGELASSEMHFGLAERILAENWGQGFPAPLFQGNFRVFNQRIVGTGHLKLSLHDGVAMHDAIFFKQAENIADQAQLLYRLDINEYRGASKLQLVVDRVVQQ